MLLSLSKRRRQMTNASEAFDVSSSFVMSERHEQSARVGLSPHENQYDFPSVNEHTVRCDLDDPEGSPYHDDLSMREDTCHITSNFSALDDPEGSPCSDEPIGEIGPWDDSDNVRYANPRAAPTSPRTASEAARRRVCGLPEPKRPRTELVNGTTAGDTGTGERASESGGRTNSVLSQGLPPPSPQSAPNGDAHPDGGTNGRATGALQDNGEAGDRASGSVPLGAAVDSTPPNPEPPPSPPRLSKQDVERRTAEIWERSLRRRELVPQRGVAQSFAGGVIPPQHRWRGVHYTHRNLAVSNNVLFCERCGCWGTFKLQRLAAECNREPANTSATQTLRRLRRGETPQSNRPWPGGGGEHHRYRKARVLNPTTQ